MKTALTIAGLDPSGGAGIIADLRAFGDIGVRGLAAAAALTAQNSAVVAGTRAVSSGFVTEQVAVLLDEFTVDAVKIGMLGSVANARAVARLVRGRGLGNVVLDPVLASTGGVPLLGGGVPPLDRGGRKAGGAARAIRALLPHVLVVTPNTIEAGVIAGVDVRGVRGIRGMKEAAERIHALGAPNVLVKGGHLGGAPIDLLFDGRAFVRFDGPRLRGPAKSFHGTGCMLSSAIAAYLALGRTLEEAAADGKDYVRKVLTERIAGG